jgi:hypothetical protein
MGRHILKTIPPGNACVTENDDVVAADGNGWLQNGHRLGLEAPVYISEQQLEDELARIMRAFTPHESCAGPPMHAAPSRCRARARRRAHAD